MRSFLQHRSSQRNFGIIHGRLPVTKSVLPATNKERRALASPQNTAEPQRLLRRAADEPTQFFDLELTMGGNLRPLLPRGRRSCHPAHFVDGYFALASLISVGVTPYCLRKHRLKYERSPKPTS